MQDKSDDQFLKVMKILSNEKLCLMKILSKEACIFRLFYWTKVMKFVNGDEHFNRRIILFAFIFQNKPYIFFFRTF